MMSHPSGPMVPVERTVKLNCSKCGKPTRSHRDEKGNVICHDCWLHRDEQQIQQIAQNIAIGEGADAIEKEIQKQTNSEEPK